MTSATELTMEIVEIVGPDVTYLRTGQRPADPRYHITGAEVASALGVAALVGFCKGVMEGVSEKLGKPVGRRIGDKLATLLGAEKKVASLDTSSVNELRAEVRELQGKLDEVLAALHEDRTLVDLDASGLQVVRVTAAVRVSASLETWGLPADKAQLYAEEITDRLLTRLRE